MVYCRSHATVIAALLADAITIQGIQKKSTEERTRYWGLDFALFPKGFKGKSPLGDKHFERTGAL